MRQHVARAEQIEDLRHQRAIGHAADMAHHARRHARQLTGLDRALERLQAVAGDHVLAHADLHAQHHVGVLGHHAGGGFGLGVVDVVELWHRKPGQTGQRHMDEGVLPGTGRGRDEAAPAGEVVGPGVTGRNHRGTALVGHQFVGRDAYRRSEGVGVAMQVDQPWRDQLAASIHHPMGSVGRDAGLNGLDQTVAHADVTLAGQALARVQHVGVAQQQVEFVGRAHGRLGGHGQRAGRSEGDARAKEVTTF